MALASKNARYLDSRRPAPLFGDFPDHPQTQGIIAATPGFNRAFFSSAEARISRAGFDIYVVLEAPSRKISEYSAFLSTSSGFAFEFEILKVVGVGSVQVVFEAVRLGLLDQNGKEIKVKIVVADEWVDISVWERCWWIWAQKRFLKRWLKDDVDFAPAAGPTDYIRKSHVL